VPTVLEEHPEVVEQLHLDFVHAGSDVTQALTYYLHREKLRVIGRERALRAMNEVALKIAKRVARKTGTLFAGDICNTNIFEPGNSKSVKEVTRIFEEQGAGAIVHVSDRSLLRWPAGVPGRTRPVRVYAPGDL
jgi:betaine-homocysteine S-methyltransferase